MLPTLRILDFDQSAYDFKQIPENLRKHNNDQFCAIATFDKNPESILTYLLDILNYSPEDINRTEVTQNTSYQLKKYYFNHCNQPLIIATPNIENYNRNVKELAFNGKLLMLNSIKLSLPPCVEYHFYEHDKTILSSLLEVNKHFNYHLIKTNIFSFEIQSFYKPQAIVALKIMLNAYSVFLKQENESKPLYNSLNALSFYSVDNPKNTLINKLIGFFDKRLDLEMEELQLLLNDEVIKAWEGNYQSLTSFVTKFKEDMTKRYSPREEPELDFLIKEARCP